MCDGAATHELSARRTVLVCWLQELREYRCDNRGREQLAPLAKNATVVSEEEGLQHFGGSVEVWLSREARALGKVVQLLLVGASTMEGLRITVEHIEQMQIQRVADCGEAQQLAVSSARLQPGWPERRNLVAE